MRIMPYRTADNVIDGVVVTFVEITRVKKAEAGEAAADQRYEDIVATARGPMAMLDADCRVVAAICGFRECLGTTPAEAADKSIYELADGRWDVVLLHRLLEEVALRDGSVADFKLDHAFSRAGAQCYRGQRLAAQSEGPRGGDDDPVRGGGDDIGVMEHRPCDVPCAVCRTLAV